MKRMRETWFVRVATLSLALAAAVAPALMDTPRRLPAVALGSELLLYAERGFALFLVLLFVMVVVTRGWKGELPIALSQRGAEWADATRDVTRELRAQIADIYEQFGRHEATLKTLSEIGLRRRA